MNFIAKLKGVSGHYIICINYHEKFAQVATIGRKIKPVLRMCYLVYVVMKKLCSVNIYNNTFCLSNNKNI